MPILSDKSFPTLPDSPLPEKQFPGHLVVAEYEEGNQGNQRRQIILRPDGKFERILEISFRFEELSLDAVPFDETAFDGASGFTLRYRWEL